MDHSEQTPEEFLASFDDPNERAKWALDCYAGGMLDSRGRPTFTPIRGAGTHCDIFRGLVGRTTEEQFLGDLGAVQSWQGREWRKEGAARRTEIKRAANQAVAVTCMLPADAFKILERGSFAMQWFGVELTAMVTVVYGEAGADQAWCAKMLTAFNEEAEGYLIRHAGEPYRFHYIWAHENGRDKGFHSHIVTRLPAPRKTFRAEFEDWAEGFWRQRLGGSGPEKIVHVSSKNRYARAGRVGQHWFWLRYLCKTLNPDATRRTDTGPTPLRTILRLPPNDAYGPIVTAQRCGSSQSLSARGQREALAFGFQADQRISTDPHIRWDDGWELEARDERLRNEQIMRDIADLKI